MRRAFPSSPSLFSVNITRRNVQVRRTANSCGKRDSWQKGWDGGMRLAAGPSSKMMAPFMRDRLRDTQHPNARVEITRVPGIGPRSSGCSDLRGSIVNSNDSIPGDWWESMEGKNSWVRWLWGGVTSMVDCMDVAAMNSRQAQRGSP